MSPPRHRVLWLLVLTIGAGCSSDDGEAYVGSGLDDSTRSAAGQEATEQADAAPSFEWNLPEGFPQPHVPADNPMSEAKVELGRHLFYDTRLSVNETQSCGSCHEQKLAFTDGRAVAKGATDEEHIRSAMGLANVAYASTLTWANPVLPDLERQALIPLFGEDPVELGMVGREQELIDRLYAEPLYVELFPEAFPEEPDEPISIDTITKAIAAFERTVISGRSRYDDYLAGDDILSAQELRGMEVFFSERAECFHCHSGFNFSDSIMHLGKPFDEVAFHNTGLYDEDGQGAYPAGNEGLYNFSGEQRDVGRFKAPSLRNVTLTAPYMHDGSIETLEQVIDHYAAGGRAARNPNKSEFVTGFEISESEKQDLIAFLGSLTDETLLEEPKLSDPWTAR